MGENLIIYIVLGIVLIIFLVIIIGAIRESKQLKKGKRLDNRSTSDIRKAIK